MSLEINFEITDCHFSKCLCVQLVEGGHRAIIFSRIGGVQPDVYREGLHFRYTLSLCILAVVVM